MNNNSNLFVVTYSVYHICSCKCDLESSEMQEYFVNENRALSRAQELINVLRVGNIKVHKAEIQDGRLAPGEVCHDIG